VRTVDCAPALGTAYATFLRRPLTVQIDTVQASHCHDSIRASYGCAASQRNEIGLRSTLRRRREPGLPRFPARMFARKVLNASQTFLMTCWAACAPSRWSSLMAW